MVGNAVLVKGMLDVLLSISHEQSRVRRNLHEVSRQSGRKLVSLFITLGNLTAY